MNVLCVVLVSFLPTKWPRTWVPIASTRELDDKRPSAVRFGGEKYVCWKSQQSWNVFLDVCPHRLAPLSEGRIDENGNIQCGYHGWEFDKCGTCKCIPQMTSKHISNTNNAFSYPTIVSESIIWFWPWDDESHSSESPSEIMKNLNVKMTFTRDFPYDWASLVENVMDPSHIPFAHHGLQGNREDAIPITVSNASITESGYTFTSLDKTMKRERIGTSTFHAPFLVKYASKFKQDDKMFNVTLLCIPTEIGMCRAILLFTSSGSNSLFSRIFNLVPIWMMHLMSNRFLDSDLIYLHEQDINVRNPSLSYKMPAACDVSIRMLDKYLKSIEYKRPPIQPRLTRRKLLDRWNTHTIHCRHCKNTYNTMEKIKSILNITLLASIILDKLKLSFVCIFVHVTISRIMEKFHFVNFEYN